MKGNAKRLPVREPPLPGESLSSLVRRTAQAMGYESMGRLTQLVGADRYFGGRLDQLDDGPVLQGLADLLGHPAQQLRALTVHRWAPSLVLAPNTQQTATRHDSKTALRFWHSARGGICQECLEEAPAYERLLWSFRPLPICTRHACWLIVRCPKCGRMPQKMRLNLIRCRCGSDLPVKPSACAGDYLVGLARAMETWLDGSAPLDGMPAAAGWAWLERLAVAIAKTEPWTNQFRKRCQVPQLVSIDRLSWLAAVELVGEWPSRQAAFLDLFQRIDKQRSSAVGTDRAFGSLLREAWKLEQLGYSVPADSLRSYLAAGFTAGHLTNKISLFREARHRKLIENRPWVIQTQAAAEIKLGRKTIVDLVRRGLLEGYLHTSGRRQIGVISKRSIEKMRQILRESQSLVEAAQELQIERHQLGELIRSGVLKGCVHRLDGWRIPRRSIEQLAQVVHGLPEPNEIDWIGYRAAVRKYGRRGLTFGKIVELAIQDRIRLARDHGCVGFQGLWIHRKQLAAEMEQLLEQNHAQQGYPLRRAAEMLAPNQQLSRLQILRWIKAGLLKGTRNGHQWFIPRENIDRFRQTYCLVAEVCEILKVSRGTFARWRKERKILAAWSRLPDRGPASSLYLRTDLEVMLQARRGE